MRETKLKFTDALTEATATLPEGDRMQLQYGPEFQLEAMRWQENGGEAGKFSLNSGRAILRDDYLSPDRPFILRSFLMDKETYSGWNLAGEVTGPAVAYGDI